MLGNYHQQLLSFSGVQVATVQGGIGECGDVDYPGLFVRLDDPSVWNFITTTTGIQTAGSLVGSNQLSI